jgi:hypothetical protein
LDVANHPSNVNGAMATAPQQYNSPQNYDILAKMLCFCLSFSAMKEKMLNTLLDVFTFCACTKKSVNLLEDFSNVFFNTLKNIEK